MSINYLVFASAEGGFQYMDSLILLVSFLILVLLLKKFAWGPLMNVMHERETFISNQIDSAEQNRLETAILLEEQRTIIKQARQEALQNIEDAKKLGEEEREKSILLGQKEAAYILESARREIEQQKNEVVRELLEKTTKLTVAIASKVLERELNEADQEKLINEMLDKVGEQDE